MAKGAQYFTLDAFIALIVVATGLMLVLAVSTYQPSSSQPQVLSQDFVKSLAQTKVREVNNPFVRQQIEAGNITNTDNTILQQAYEFRKYGRGNFSEWLLANVTQSLVPVQYNFQISFGGEAVLSRGQGQPTSDLLVSSKQLVFGVVNKSEEFWGPVTVEVRVWQ